MPARRGPTGTPPLTILIPRHTTIGPTDKPSPDARSYPLPWQLVESAWHNLVLQRTLIAYHVGDLDPDLLPDVR